MKLISFISTVLLTGALSTAALAQNATPASKEKPVEKPAIVKTQPWTISVRDVDHPLIPKHLRGNSLVLTNSRNFSAVCNKDRNSVEVFVGYDSYATMKKAFILAISPSKEVEEEGVGSVEHPEEIDSFLTRTGSDLWSHSFTFDKGDERVSHFEDWRFIFQHEKTTFQAPDISDMDDWKMKAQMFRTMCQLTSEEPIKEEYRSKSTTAGFFAETPDGPDHVNIVMNARLNPTPRIVKACRNDYDKNGWKHANHFQITYGLRRCYIQNTPDQNLDPVLRKLKFAMMICGQRRYNSGMEYTACIDPVFLK